jgi:hypothetical protein
MRAFYVDMLLRIWQATEMASGLFLLKMNYGSLRAYPLLHQLSVFFSQSPSMWVGTSYAQGVTVSRLVSRGEFTRTRVICDDLVHTAESRIPTEAG